MSYAEYNIDRYILDWFEGLAGVYLEAGASDPINQSNTFLLEQNGWKGLLVEPRLQYDYATLRPNSIFENYALVDDDYKNDTIEAGELGHMSGVTPHHFPETTTLSSHKRVSINTWKCIQLRHLLKKHTMTHVNFFSLDVEGYEHQVLSGIDFNYTVFDVIIIEFHTLEYSMFNLANDFTYLENYGYESIGVLPNAHHHVYVHKSFNNKTKIKLL